MDIEAMTKILFVCHGNICRSPMAEFVMKDLVQKAGLTDQFHIASAATSREEIGNPVYPPARRKLAEHGISCAGHAARQLHQTGLCRLRLPRRHGQRQSSGYAPHMRRRPGWENLPAPGPHRPTRQCGRPLVHRRLPGNMAGCDGGLPRPAGRVRWRLPKAVRIIRPSNLEARNFCVFFVKNSVLVPEPKNTEFFSNQLKKHGIFSLFIFRIRSLLLEIHIPLFYNKFSALFRNSCIIEIQK